MEKKHSALLLWLGSALMMLLGSGWVAILGQVVFWLLFVAHVVECVMHRDLFRRAGGPMSYHYVQTMIYGLFHWKPIQQRLEAEEPSA